jgi:hypothetical protein
MTRTGGNAFSSNATANALLIVTCLAVLGYHAYGRVARSEAEMPEAVAREEVWPAGTPAPFDVVQVQGEAARHVVLLVHSGCRFCKEEMPFYRELVTAAESAGVRVHIAGSEDQATLRAYAEAEGLFVTSVFPEVAIDGLRSTPTVLVADAAGLVERTWQGVMSDRQKADLRGWF